MGSGSYMRGDNLYHMTVHEIPVEWRGRQIPIPPPPGCHLHSFGVSGSLIVCMWEQVGAIADDWGVTVSASIPELAGLG